MSNRQIIIRPKGSGFSVSIEPAMAEGVETIASYTDIRSARGLAERGMIHVDGAGKYSLSRTLPDLGKTRVYIVKPEIFGGDDA